MTSYVMSSDRVYTFYVDLQRVRLLLYTSVDETASYRRLDVITDQLHCAVHDSQCESVSPRQTSQSTTNPSRLTELALM